MYIDYGEDERIPYIIFREGTPVKVRKPRRLHCGYEAQVGDTIYQTVGKSDGEFFYHEHCQRCDYEMHGFEFPEGEPRHGNVLATSAKS